MLSLYYEINNRLITVLELDKIKDILASKSKNSLLKVIAPSISEINFLIEELKFHIITIKNFTSSKHIPKVEEYNDYISTIMYDIQLDEKQINYNIATVGIILMPTTTVVLCKTELGAFDEILLRIMSNLNNNFSDTCNLYYIILDVLVDNLFTILSFCENKLDLLQQNLLNKGIKYKDYAEKIMNIRRIMLELRKGFSYEQEVLYRISHEELTLVCTNVLPYMKDVFHHMEKLNATLQEYNDWASNLSDAYEAFSSSKLNDRLQMLTIIQYIFMPLGFLTGWYGMGFKMPEEGFQYSYPIFILAVILITGWVIIYFKKNKLL